jgi:hypothetical protein
VFSITGVYASQTYEYTAHATGYQNATGQVVVGTTNLNMGDIIVNELAFPPLQVVATEAVNFSNVAVTWMAPDPNAVGEWIHYDSGENNDSIGTGAAADFDVATLSCYRNGGLCRHEPLCRKGLASSGGYFQRQSLDWRYFYGTRNSSSRSAIHSRSAR